jgi:photosystem II stability/assembly factor-like uncharacterized protein
MSRSNRALAAAVACAPLLAAAPASATSWTEVPSGTTAEITAIDYQSESRAWFTTSDGRVFRADGGRFVQTGTAAGKVFADVAFQPGGNVGVAVTTDGEVRRSVDGGATWGPVPVLTVDRSCSDDTGFAVRRLSAVFWAGDSVVYYVGGGGATNQPIVLRGTEPIVTPRTVNSIDPGPGCRVGEGNDTVTDGFALPSAPGTLRFVTDDFGTVFASGDALATPASTFASMTNGTGGVPRLAVDPANPNRLWVTSTTGGGLTYAAPGPARQEVRRADTGLPVVGSLYDVDFAGGTVVAVGDGGAIYTSVDGTTAHRQPAAGALAGTAWRSVSLADGGAALVGGAGGALVKTTDANAIPSTPGPGLGPTDPSPRPPVGSGGSGRRGGTSGATGTPPNVSGRPAAASTGGATIAVWKRIALSKGRYVPVRVSARSARRFVIEVRRAQRPHRRVGMAKAKLAKPGRTLVKVPLRSNVRTGKYRIVVRVYKGRRAIGKRVTIAIVVTR